MNLWALLRAPQLSNSRIYLEFGCREYGPLAAPRVAQALARSQEIVDRGWVTPGNLMVKSYLDDVVTEKNHGVRLAEALLRDVEAVRRFLKPADLCAAQGVLRAHGDLREAALCDRQGLLRIPPG